MHTVRVVCAMLLFEDGYDLAALGALPQAMMCRVENEVNLSCSVLQWRHSRCSAIADASLSAAPKFARNRFGERRENFPSFQTLETGWLGLGFLSASWKQAGWLGAWRVQFPRLRTLL